MSGSRLARKARFLRWAMNFYPPYIGAGVRVRHISADMRLVQVKMVLRWYNRNYVVRSSAARCIRWSTRSSC